jgi:hypothetical protein
VRCGWENKRYVKDFRGTGWINVDMNQLLGFLSNNDETLGSFLHQLSGCLRNTQYQREVYQP